MFEKHGHMEIHGFTDADWAGNPNDWRSTAGYFTFVGGNLVTWRSKKQKVVALSSVEAEFRGIKSGLTEVLWLWRLDTIQQQEADRSTTPLKMCRKNSRRRSNQGSSASRRRFKSQSPTRNQRGIFDSLTDLATMSPSS